MIKNLFGETMQEVQEAEMNTMLRYGKNEHSVKPTDNCCNGHSKKSVVSEYGDTELDIPWIAKVNMSL
jgi:transposase-like protein